MAADRREEDWIEKLTDVETAWAAPTTVETWLVNLNDLGHASTTMWSLAALLTSTKLQ